MRKQKHLDDLVAQVAQLKKENHQIITRINITTQHYLNVESDNSILRAQKRLCDTATVSMQRTVVEMKVR